MEKTAAAVAPEKFICYNRLSYYANHGRERSRPVLDVKIMDNIILIGMPGSGKSSVGVVLAKALGMDFLDVDLLIQSREGALLQQILDERGIEEFLDVEGQAIRTVKCSHTVIAPGGSCVCRQDAMEHLRALGTVVYLRLPLEEVTARIHNLSTRGIALRPGQTMEDVYDYRTPLYERYAHLTVEAGGLSLTETVEAVKQAVAATPQNLRNISI